MKILASDFDNTIYLEDDKEKTLKNVEAIKEFVEKGNIFCVITGRNYTDLKIFLNELKIPYTYLICEDGAKIFNYSDYCLDTTYLDKETIEKVQPIIEKYTKDYYLDDGYNKTTNLNDCVKIVVNCIDEVEKEQIVKVIKEKNLCHIYASRVHINIIEKTVNKENALKKLINLEDLDYDKVHVIGDNDNDYEMLRYFNGGVIKKHHKKLDELNKKEYNYLYEYIEELMKN